MGIEFKYACPANGCKFMSKYQCNLRRGVTLPPSTTAKQTLHLIDLSYCRECLGPIPADKYVPRVRKQSEPVVLADDSILPTSVFQSRNSPKIFTQLGPRELWTGSRCGCTKPRREFYDGSSSECKECRLKREYEKRRFDEVVRRGGMEKFIPKTQGERIAASKAKVKAIMG